MLSGKTFPRCATCAKPVYFKQITWLARETASSRYRLLAKHNS